MSSIKVLKAGFFTTVQDLGRTGYQKFGMPVAGVMDNFSCRVANYLVGNDEKEAVLETTFLGPELEFYEDIIISITGANMKPKINGREIPMWESVKVTKGDKLVLGSTLCGLRNYIAFGGEIDLKLVNNSKSTFVKSEIGGFNGRKLKDNDELDIKVSKAALIGRYIDSKYIPELKNKNTIRVIMGPQEDYFTEEGINTFLSLKGYKITKEADRMGYRLDGDAIKHEKKADIISDGTVFGSVQVPANGKPIILMADRQTTGGYTKIATVISPDLPMVAQMGYDNEIIFEKVSLEEAHQIYKEYENRLAIIKNQISKCQTNNEGAFNGTNHENIVHSKTMKIAINGKSYVVDVQEVR
ncbi:MAG: biotin-dependent carboxyltransferase family protein [Sedimentibacter sp.]